jgi:sigma-B regulation protein RsbU (phosphoserine phosphatase)
LSQYAVPLALNLLVPVVGLGLGFAVVAIRPRDWNAWLVLFLMLGFTETVTRSYTTGPFADATLAWNAFWAGMWPSFLLLFGIYFPTRSLRDKRWPWIKYILIAAFTAINLGYWTIVFVGQHNINTAAAAADAFGQLTVLRVIALIVANAAFFANFRRKSAAESSADARRRLDILRTGSWIGLGPTILLGFYAVIIRSELFVRVPWPITVFALLFLVLFPLTLGYVIVVERAMDLRFVIRSGVKYGFANAGLWTVRAIFVAIAIYLFFAARRGARPSEVIELSAIGFALLVLRQRGADRVSRWIDRKFFREAYDAEKVLADLAGEVG